jgi:hypothetical protein
MPVRKALIGALISAPFLVGATLAQSDGSAVANPDQPGVTFQDRDIIESSGLVDLGDQIVTMNDSGDTARVFTVDLGTGKTVGVTHWNGAAEDLESLAPAGPGEVWAGDTGDNGHSRSSITVARVPVGSGDRTVDVPSYDLVYPDGPRDAETLLSDPATGRLYVVSKTPMGGTVYAAPSALKAGVDNQLAPIGSVLGLATDGAFFPDGKHIVIRNYTSASVYSFPGLALQGSWILPRQKQGEGLAVAADDSLYLSSEGSGQAIVHTEVPAGIRAVMEGRALAPTPATTPAPTSSPTPSSTPVARAQHRASGSSGEVSPWPWILAGGAGLTLLVALFGTLRPR